MLPYKSRPLAPLHVYAGRLTGWASGWRMHNGFEGLHRGITRTYSRLSGSPACACRKAYRLGKWLADVNAMRKVPLTSRFAALELLSAGGSAVYYFTEQLTW